MKKELVEDWTEQKRNLVTGFVCDFRSEYKKISKDYYMEPTRYRRTDQYNE